MCIGGALGLGVASKVGPTELPQTVAAFHSLVGVAAAATSLGERESVCVRERECVCVCE
jgi:H+-translocating NAD(P) transhydrogenase